MFVLNKGDNSISVTRGDAVSFFVSAVNDAGEVNVFRAGDIIRMKIFGKKDCSNVVLKKDFLVDAERERVNVFLTGAETKIGEVLNKPKDYWYEIELNPLTKPQTIVGYDDNGPKIFRLFPEGGDCEEVV